MTEEQIKELEWLQKLAEPLPWKEDLYLTSDGDSVDAVSNNDGDTIVHTDESLLAESFNCAYIVAACNAAPELIAENRALRERVRELEIREADYIEERDALLCTKYALERQKELLARNLAEAPWCLACQIKICPQMGKSIDPLRVDREECKNILLRWAEEAAKEAGK